MKKTLYTIVLILCSCCIMAQENNEIVANGNQRDVETVVGAIGGTVDVSSLGGATYTIPIQVPEGLGGIQPNIAISYNSQSGNGLLGWCWDLQGISTITRVGTTLYHDGYMSGVDFVNDHFALDGQRLICLSGNNGGNGSEYRTEIDGMSKIVSYTCDTTNGPAYFKVWLPNGNIAYYGNSNDSRIGLKQHGDVCIWLLNRVEDRNGNYMTYHYNKGNTKYTLSTINYCGNSNANISCKYSMQLFYSPRLDEEKTFVGNNHFDHNRIIDSIMIKRGNTILHKYRFDYYETDFNNGYYYMRLRRIEFSCGNESFKPTFIKWGQNNYHNNNGLTKTIKLENGSSPGFAGKIKFTGDFNGDGYTDVLAYYKDTDNSKKAICYINKGVANNQQLFKIIDTIPLNSNIDWIYVADINGDGLDDFTLSSRNRTIVGKDILTLDTYLSTINPQGMLSFVLATKTFGDFKIKKRYKESVLVGDFLGEGKQSLLVQEGEDSRPNPRLFYITFSNNVLSATELPSNMVLDVDRMIACDFNGDGISEIYYSDETSNATGLKRLKLLDPIFYYEDVSLGMLSPWHQIFIGDFNGDGKSDLLTYVEDGNGVGAWSIHYFEETAMTWPSYRFSCTTMGIGNPGYHGFSLKYLSEPSYEFISVGDFNGDGKTDIAVRTSNNQMRFLYAPIRRGDDEALFASIQTVNLSDMGLSGASNQTICMGNFLGHENMNIFSINDLYAPELLPDRYSVTSIVDGMGNSYSFQYDYLMPKLSGSSNSDFYKRTRQSGEEQNHDMYTISLPIKGLRQVTISNIALPNRSSKTVYSYQNALAHKSGRGFLGFKTTVVDYYLDNTRQKTIERVYDNYLPSITPYLSLSINTVHNYDGRILSITKNNTVLLYKYRSDGPYNKKIFVPVVTKQISDIFDQDYTNEYLKKVVVEYTYNDSLFQVGTDSFRAYNILKQTDVKQGTDTRSTVTLADSCEFQNITHTDYVDETTGLISTWTINRPSRTLETKRRLGENNDVSMLTVYDYSTNPTSNPFLPSSITQYPSGYENATDPLATTKTFSYLQTGAVSAEYRQDLLQTLPQQSSFFEYNSDGRFMTKKTNPAGYETRFEYDENYGLLKMKTDCNGKVTRYQTTPLGLSRTTTYPDETVLQEGTDWVDPNDTMAPFDACYYQWIVKTGSGENRTYYNAVGDKLRTVSPGLTTNLIYKDYSYNNKGLLAKESLPYFGSEPNTTIYWTFYQYDSNNRLVQTTHPDGLAEGNMYFGLTTEHIYWTDPDFPSVTSTTVNVMGWTVESYDEDFNKVLYDYYPDGALRWTQINNDESTRISLNYDAARNRICLMDPNYGVSISTYNAYGQQTKFKTPKDNYTTYEYDILGRMTKRFEYDEENNTIDSTHWVYCSTPGLLGLLQSVVYDGKEQIIAYSYDNLNRVSHVSEMRRDKYYNTSYTYDQASRVASVTYPTGFRVNNSYTASGQLYKLSDNNQNRLWETLEKNAQGQIETYITGDGLTTRRSYVPENGRLAKILTTHGNDTVQNYSYSYDVLGNLAIRTDSIHDMSESFLYDKLNRLTGIVEGNDTTGWFVYDAYGRMLSKYIHSAQVFDSAVYNADNRPHAIAHAKTSMDLPLHQLSYTLFDKLSFLEQDTVALNYRYGYDHQRMHMAETNTDGDTLRQKVYVGNCEHVINGSDTTILTYLNGPLGVFGIQEEMDYSYSHRYFIHSDHLGSWTLITDNTANIQQDVAYDAWGTPYRFTTTGTEPADSLLFDRGFTGHEHLSYFGLINMNGRMYDPFTSGFLSVDNYVQSPGYTQSFNRYAYCLNNPLKYTDPDGEFAILDAWINGFIYGFFSSSENRLSNAVKKANQMAKNDAKIWAGLVQADSNKNFWGRNWEVISKLTWQSPQEFIGLGWSLAKNFVGVVDRVEYFDDATYVINENWKSTGKQGVTLGNYINIDMDGTIPNETSFSAYVLNNHYYNTSIFMHEYGHTIQSKRWGPLYLLSIGLPSLISGAAHDGENHNHHYFYTEVWANRRAQKHFSDLYGTEWDYDHYPIEWEEQP